MKEDLEELFTQEESAKPASKLIYLLKRFWWVFALGGVGGIYIYFIFFGDNSVGVFRKLQKQKIQIEEQVKSLQNENVELQKVIFELKGLEPNFEEKK